VNAEIKSIAGIITQNSPLFIHDKNTDTRYTFYHKKEAVEMLDHLNNFNAGLVSINQDISQKYNLKSAQILDPCISIKTASKVLNNLQNKCLKEDKKNQGCTLISYGSLVGIDDDYLQGVLINYRSEQQNTVLSQAKAESSSIFPDGSNFAEEAAIDWSNSDLFIDVKNDKDIKIR